MSVRVMSEVFSRYPSGGGEMLLALALADVARDDGALMINDSVPELARKTRQTDRGVRLQLQRMQRTGWLQVVKQSDGGRGRVTSYRINKEWIAGTDLVAPSDDTDAAPETLNVVTLNPERRSGFAKPETLNAATVNPEPRSGAYRPLRPNTNTTPLTPQGGLEGFSEEAAPPKRGPIALATWLAECKASGSTPIPPDDPVFGYCATVGIGTETLALHWFEFKRRRMRTGKRQRDWRQTFRNSVEANWFSLWFIKPGLAAELTTQGLQAMALQRAERLALERAEAGETVPLLSEPA